MSGQTDHGGDSEERGHWLRGWGMSIVLGVALGAGMGVALDDTALGFGIGVAMGAALGTSYGVARQRSSGEEHSPEPTRQAPGLCGAAAR